MLLFWNEKITKNKKHLWSCNQKWAPGACRYLSWRGRWLWATRTPPSPCAASCSASPGAGWPHAGPASPRSWPAPRPPRSPPRTRSHPRRAASGKRCSAPGSPSRRSAANSSGRPVKEWKTLQKMRIPFIFPVEVFIYSHVTNVETDPLTPGSCNWLSQVVLMFYVLRTVYNAA